jgi:hypothetical protein
MYALPLKALIKLQEVAALLAAGEPIATFLAREKLGKRRGKVQVQQREDLDRGQRSEAAVMAENAATEETERAEIAAAVRSTGMRAFRRNLR